jgi:hypothetical protein
LRANTSVNDAVTQALAMQPPDGVDPVIFGKLRDELVRQLRLRGDDKFAAKAPTGAGGQVRDLSYDGLSTLTWSYANAGDYNLDGIVGVADITPLATYFGADTNDGIGNDELETWLDGDGNGVIGIGDITPLAMGFGAEVAEYHINGSFALAGPFDSFETVSFASRDTGVVPPRFSYAALDLGVFGIYINVQPVDSQSTIGIESLAISLATGNTVIATGTVGSGGGSLDGGSLQVEFLAGTFSADTPLILETGADDKYEDQAAGGYRILGLPDTFLEPITIRLKMTEPPGPDGIPLLALEEGEVLLYGTQTAPGRDARYLQGTVDNGWFTAIIPATANDLGTSSLRGTSAETNKTVYVTVVNRRHYLYSSSGRFLVYFPAADEVLASTVADALDTAYPEVEATGLSWDRRTAWPLEVTIRIMGASSFDGEMTTSRFWGVNGATITINSTNMASDDIAKATAGHELMHVAQYCYDKRNRVSSSLSGGGWVWMDDACATWFEKRMASVSFIPSTVESNVGFLEQALETDTNEHGYGASMFMTYMAQKQGNAFIGDISMLKWDGYAPIDAVKHITSSSIDVDWEVFCEDYMKLAVYGADTYPIAANINSLQQGSYSFDDDTKNVGPTFSWANAPNLSARVFRIEFGPNNAWEDIENLAVKFYGADPNVAPTDAALIIAKYANNMWTYLAADSVNSFDLKDIKPTADAQGAYYFMVVNQSANTPYSGARADTINLKLTREDDFLSRLHMCDELLCQTWASATYNRNPGTPIFDSFLEYDRTFTTIQWSNNDFWSDHEAPTFLEDYYVSGTVNPVSKTATLTFTYAYDGQASFDTWLNYSTTFTNVPMSVLFASVEGSQYGTVCAPYVTDISGVGFMDEIPYLSNSGEDYAISYSDFAFNAEDFFRIEFSDSSFP